VQLITQIAQRAGFGGGVVVDYPNSKKARKVFLVLFVGGGGGGGNEGGTAGQQQLPKGLDGVAEDEVKFEKRRQREGRREKNKKKKVKDRDWILKKKEVCSLHLLYYWVRVIDKLIIQLYRRRGKEDVPRDSKYTGRKRKAVF
jgi:18S rRNA (guanine1575-N7)-methyltransferase